MKFSSKLAEKAAQDHDISLYEMAVHIKNPSGRSGYTLTDVQRVIGIKRETSERYKKEVEESTNKAFNFAAFFKRK